MKNILPYLPLVFVAIVAHEYILQILFQVFSAIPWLLLLIPATLVMIMVIFTPPIFLILFLSGEEPYRIGKDKPSDWLTQRYKLNNKVSKIFISLLMIVGSIGWVAIAGTIFDNLFKLFE